MDRSCKELEFGSQHWHGAAYNCLLLQLTVSSASPGLDPMPLASTDVGTHTHRPGRRHIHLYTNKNIENTSLKIPCCKSTFCTVDLGENVPVTGIMEDL